MAPILQIQNISKRFAINHEQQPYLSLRDSIANVFKKTSSTEDFWALKNISFDVNEGDAVGIIGKNGAGKSTLLKILSKITPPTSGRIIGRGRIASLLEVGTGFHPELSGRENVFMNGSILGMKRAEILRNFDAIVDFAGVEKFIDTPLKHYSSGMQLRLAFAVAAFLENEILIIDEVLAVGDAEFQKKCISKMESVTSTGRTLLFVSHDLNSLSKICNKALLLQQGQIVTQGKTTDVIANYLHGQQQSNVWQQTKALTTETYFTKVSTQLNGTQPNLSITIKFELHTTAAVKPAFVAFNILNQLGQTIGQAIPNTTPFIMYSATAQQFECTININGFVPDTYYVSAWIGSHYANTYDWQKEIISFQIIESPQLSRTYPHRADCGAIVPSSTIKQLL